MKTGFPLNQQLARAYGKQAVEGFNSMVCAISFDLYLFEPTCSWYAAFGKMASGQLRPPIQLKPPIMYSR